jgi:hypothetical protein
MEGREAMAIEARITAATQIQRWRDFQSQVAAYVLGNLLLIGMWAVTGRGAFGPAGRCWSGDLASRFSTSTRFSGVRSPQIRQTRTFRTTRLKLASQARPAVRPVGGGGRAASRLQR